MGDPLCWSGPLTYEACCVQKSLDCWDAFYTEARCCAESGPDPAPGLSGNQPVADGALGKQKGLIGNPACWSGPLTYEACCVQKSLDCWDAFYTEARCCAESGPDPAPGLSGNQPVADGALGKQKGLIGNPACWSGPLTYEACCVQKSLDCWDAFYTEARCCAAELESDPNLVSQQVLVSSVENEPAPKGDPACWSGPFTYEVCCVERSVNCWDTHHTEGRCCLDWSKFWTDRPGCWAEGRTFQACCIEGRDDCWAYDLRFASRCCGGAFTISQLRDTIQSFLAAAGEPPPVLLLLAALSMPATLGVVGVEHGAESHGRRELKAVQAVRGSSYPHGHFIPPAFAR